MDEIEQVPQHPLPHEEDEIEQVPQHPLPHEEGGPPPPPQLPADIPRFSIDQLTSWTKNFSTRIGKGGQGVVYLGRMENLSNTVWIELEVAVKMSPVKKDIDPNEEAATLAQFHHQNIISLIGVCNTPTHSYIVMPFMANGSLSSKYRSLNWSQIVNVLSTAALGLKQLHDRVPVMIYRDFKTENILLDENLNAVLCDFGTVGLSDKRGVMCTPGYVDPKYVKSAFAKPTQDIYSFGVVLLYVIIQYGGSVMFVHGKYHVKQWAELKAKKKRHVVAKHLLSNCWLRRTGCSKNDAVKITALGLRCVHNDVTKRPNIDEVIEELQQLTV